MHHMSPHLQTALCTPLLHFIPTKYREPTWRWYIIPTKYREPTWRWHIKDQDKTKFLYMPLHCMFVLAGDRHNDRRNNRHGSMGMMNSSSSNNMMDHMGEDHGSYPCKYQTLEEVLLPFFSVSVSISETKRPEREKSPNRDQQKPPNCRLPSGNLTLLQAHGAVRQARCQPAQTALPTSQQSKTKLPREKEQWQLHEEHNIAEAEQFVAVAC